MSATEEKKIVEHLSNLIKDLMVKSHSSTNAMYSTHMGEVLDRITIIETMNKSQLASLDRVEAQTIKTNGRVSKLEGWREWMTGGMAALVMMGIPIIAWMLYQDINMDKNITQAVAQALQPYAKP